VYHGGWPAHTHAPAHTTYRTMFYRAKIRATAEYGWRRQGALGDHTHGAQPAGPQTRTPADRCSSGSCPPAETRPQSHEIQHWRGARMPPTHRVPAAAAAEPRILKLDMSRDTAAARAPTRWTSVRTRHVAPLTHAPDDPSPFTLRVSL